MILSIDGAQILIYRSRIITDGSPSMRGRGRGGRGRGRGRGEYISNFILEMRIRLFYIIVNESSPWFYYIHSYTGKFARAFCTCV